MLSDEHFMQRCIQLAQLGAGKVSPNPMVGCVIVHKNKIIGEGYHQLFGGPHAEVNAINSIADKQMLKQSVLYVNLEPCAHFGKTPPCTNLIITHQIPKVVIGTSDPFEKVNGKGISMLKESGVEVISKILDSECAELNKRFFTYHIKKRPYIIIKTAHTKDGFIGITERSNTKDRHITNMAMQMYVHKMRSHEDAICAGTNTILQDNPRLDVRYYGGKKPLRVVIDRNLRIPLTYNIFDGSQPTLLVTQNENLSLIKPSPGIEVVGIDFENPISEVLAILHNKKVQSLIVEGGHQLIKSFIEAGYWDEAFIIEGNKWWGAGIAMPSIHGELVDEFEIDGDFCRHLKNNN